MVIFYLEKTWKEHHGDGAESRVLDEGFKRFVLDLKLLWLWTSNKSNIMC